MDPLDYADIPLIVSTPFELLNLYGTKTKRLHVTQKDPTPDKTSSAATIMKLVRSRLLGLNSKNRDNVIFILSKIPHGLSQPNRIINTFEEEFELAMALQIAAEQVIKKRFVSARKLLSRCQNSVSKTGTPLQRIVYYFAQALQQKMDLEWGFITIDNSEDQESKKPIDVLQTWNAIQFQPAWISSQQKFSASLVCQYTSVQSILDDVTSSTRIHLIDIRIQNGSHWTVLIQALAGRYDCPVELLKITAVGTSNELLEETGKRLSDFAGTMNVPFMFEVVLSDLKEIKKEMFRVETDETLAIYSSLCLWSVLAWPNDLKNLINEIKKLKQCLMVVNEKDANLNSPDFVERFVETLFHTSGVFDRLMTNFENHSSRKLIEEDLYGDIIRNIITCDGIDRTYRHESSSFWRALFKRCGLMEKELSPLALSQAKLLLDTSANGVHIETDGKCMTAGWNGTPSEFVSTWKVPFCD